MTIRLVFWLAVTVVVAARVRQTAAFVLPIYKSLRKIYNPSLVRPRRRWRERNLLLSHQRTPSRRKHRVALRSILKCDLETPDDLRLSKILRHVGDIGLSIPRSIAAATTNHSTISSSVSEMQNKTCCDSVRQAETSHGMPWRSSIDPEYDEDQLFFMPFWEKQMSTMKENLVNLRAVPAVSHKGEDMTYSIATNQTMRMHTLLFASDEYNRIRVTLMDFGRQFQAFTTAWYPHPSSNLPLFGVNMMQFGKRNHISSVDFHPIHSEEQDHDECYEHLMRPIRNMYPSLHGALNPKVYDGKEFFSNQTLLGRQEVGSTLLGRHKIDEGDMISDPDKYAEDISRLNEMVSNELLPGFEKYMKTHIDLVKSTPPNIKRIQEVLKKHADFGNFFLQRDPTRAVLSKEFGDEFANDFVEDVFFPLSGRAKKSSEDMLQRRLLNLN